MGLINWVKWIAPVVSNDWTISYAFVRGEEGGNVDDKDDAGGRTSRGITQSTYNADRRRRGLPTQDVYLASEAEVEAIYRSTFWDPYCNKFPSGVNLVAFDFGVTSGPHRANLTLQSALRVEADGVIGPKTLEALANWPVQSVIDNFTTLRRQFYYGLKQPKFENGWINRANAAERAAIALAGNKK